MYLNRLAMSSTPTMNRLTPPPSATARQGALFVRESAIQHMMSFVSPKVTRTLEQQAEELNAPLRNALLGMPAPEGNVKHKGAFTLNAALLSLSQLVQTSGKAILGNPTHNEPIEILTPTRYERVVGQYLAPSTPIRTLQVKLQRAEAGNPNAAYKLKAQVLEHSALNSSEMASLYRRMGKPIPPVQALQPQPHAGLSAMVEAHTAKVFSNLYGLREDINGDFFRSAPHKGR